VTFIPEGREQDLAQWSSVLAVDMTADALMEAYSEALQAWENLPWWRFRARKRALWRAELYLAIYWAVATKAQKEDRAR
jgi:hypothetical protein